MAKDKIEITAELRVMIDDVVQDDDISDSQLQQRIYDVIELRYPGKYKEDDKYEIFWQELAG